MSRAIKWNVASSTFLYAVNIAVAFFISPFLVHALGNRDYGLWDVILGVIGYMGLLDLGMGPALVRYVAVAEANNDDIRLKTLVSSAFFFFLLVGLAAFCILAFLGCFPTVLLGSQASEVSSIGLVFLIVGANLFVQFPGTVFVSTLMGLQRHYFINSLRSVLAVVQALLIVFMMKKYPDYGLMILASMETLGLFVQYALYGALFLASSKLPKPSIKLFSWPVVKEMWWFGIKNSMLMLASRLQKQTVPFVIGRMLGLQTVVFFSLPNRLVEYGRGLSVAMGFPLMPYFGALSQSKDVENIKLNWKKASYALQVVTLAMPVFLWFAGEPFLRIWIGPEYADKGAMVLKFLIVGLAVEAVSPNAGRFLVGAAEHGKAAKIWLIVSVLFIPGAVVGAYCFGLIGVALASAVASSVGSFATLCLACRQLGISVGVHMRETVLPLVLPLTLTAISLWMLFRYWPPVSYVTLISGSVVAAGGYLGIVLLQLKMKKSILS